MWRGGGRRESELQIFNTDWIKREAQWEGGRGGGGGKVKYLCCACASLIKRESVFDNQQEGTNTPSAPTLLLLLLLLFIISTRQHQNKNRCCFVSPFCLTSPLCLLLLAGSSSSSQVCPQTPRRRLTLASLHPNQRRRLVWLTSVTLFCISSTFISQTQIRTLWITFKRFVFRI